MVLSNGEVRFADGQLQRWHAQSKKWVQPSKWNELETKTKSVPDFTAGTFWACQYHWYSKDCWTTVYAAFQIAGKETGENFIVDLYNKSSWLNWLMAFGIGTNLFPLFVLFGMPRILGDPEQNLPPTFPGPEQQLYDEQSWFQWLWWAYLSFDQQIVLFTFIMYMLADPDRKDPDTGESLATSSFLEVVQKYAFGVWRQLPEEELRKVATEYMQYEFELWVMINVVYFIGWFALYAFGIQPLVKWFCNNYHPQGYTISYFRNYDICTLPEYYTYG